MNTNEKANACSNAKVTSDEIYNLAYKLEDLKAPLSLGLLLMEAHENQYSQIKNVQTDAVLLLYDLFEHGTVEKLKNTIQSITRSLDDLSTRLIDIGDEFDQRGMSEIVESLRLLDEELANKKG